MKRWLLAAFLLLVAGASHAALEVVATTSNLGMLARTVGGDAVKVTVLAPPDRDPHYLQARPSMMAALRGADLVVAVGADLEVGWLPAALQGSANPRIRAGGAGYFEAAAQVRLLDPQPADRALGDVHPEGNPHIYLDPPRMVQVGHALAEHLARLDPANAAAFRGNARVFENRVAQRLPQWRERVAGTPGVVLYHKDAEYLTRLLDVPVLGYIEAIAGVPPTGRHLQALVGRLQGKRGAVLHADFQSGRGPEYVARMLAWPRFALPLEAGLEADAEAYLRLIDRWVEAIAAAR